MSKITHTPVTPLALCWWSFLGSPGPAWCSTGKLQCPAVPPVTVPVQHSSQPGPRAGPRPRRDERTYSGMPVTARVTVFCQCRGSARPLHAKSISKLVFMSRKSNSQTWIITVTQWCHWNSGCAGPGVPAWVWY